MKEWQLATPPSHPTPFNLTLFCKYHALKNIAFVLKIQSSDPILIDLLNCPKKSNLYSNESKSSYWLGCTKAGLPHNFHCCYLGVFIENKVRISINLKTITDQVNFNNKSVFLYSLYIPYCTSSSAGIAQLSKQFQITSTNQ